MISDRFLCLKLCRGFILTKKEILTLQDFGDLPPWHSVVIFRFKNKSSKVERGFRNFGFEFLRVIGDV
jgi:hypothetical protein